MSEPRTYDQLAYIRAHNTRVRDLSASAWLGTAALALAIASGFTGSGVLYAAATIAFFVGACWNLSSFLWYRTRIAKADKAFEKSLEGEQDHA